MEALTPQKIVEELDRFIVGQQEAKRAVAIALRNRYRRQLLEKDLRDEVIPKNIIMIGPTGVGKTEIARRLARLANAPFIKVEVTKFTEVGYVGRDVDSMVRDLVETSVRMVRLEKMDEVRGRAEALAEERLVEILLPLPSARKETMRNPFEQQTAIIFPELNRAEKEKAELQRQLAIEIRNLRQKIDSGKSTDEEFEAGVHKIRELRQNIQAREQAFEDFLFGRLTPVQKARYIIFSLEFNRVLMERAQRLRQPGQKIK